MRLLQLGADGQLTLTDNLVGKVPAYAILSHTWSLDPNEEVKLEDVVNQQWKIRPGHRKILFCGTQARRDGIEYFWVDTCCIDKSSSAELTEALNSMFRWYRDAKKCYVYLSDVSHDSSQPEKLVHSTWKIEFRKSRWFSRGWTLQELVAPGSVDFFSKDQRWVGSKRSLGQTIHETTGIPTRILSGAPISEFGCEERIAWSRKRETTRPEDKAYSLLGILGVHMSIIYGEGEESAFQRLRTEFSTRSTKIQVLGKLPMADGAAYNSHANEHAPKCLIDTRTDVLRDISHWAQDPATQNLYWLSGMAGTGKSTISRTLAYMCAENGGLGATFFFKKGEGDRRGMSKFFTTIIGQLILQLPELSQHVQAVLDADPAITSKSMGEQFQRLIIGPISEISPHNLARGTRLIIVDALDECEREEDVQVLIKLLSGVTSATHALLKFFLTSRPELPIRIGFKTVHGMYRDLILHQVGGPIIEHDLAIYFKHELGKIRLIWNQTSPQERKLPSNWPDAAELSTLVQMAIPLFIFAATVCRFVADRKGGSPDKKLRRVLQFRATQGSKLDATYRPVLEQLTFDLPLKEHKEISLQFRRIVGPIVMLASPLDCASLSQLLSIPTDDIADILDFLHSVLQVPSSPRQPIRLLHLSFRDFLIDPERCNYAFWIDEKHTHQELAISCLQILNTSLKTDICEVQDPGTLVSSVPMQQITEKLPAEVQYACRYWIFHFQESAAVRDTVAIWKFCSEHFLHWLEALSWMGRLSESLGMIKALQSLFPARKDPRMSAFLTDSERFILAASSSIQIAPLQAYLSALVFAPSQSIIRGIYQKNLAKWVTLEPKMPWSWGERRQTLEGHSSSVKSVAFSPDGKFVVSASDDTTVILWAADTGERCQTLEGHSSSVNSVAFSPDGKLVASASDDRTVILWATDTGERRQALEGHSSSVNSVAFSPDGKLVASASDDSTVILWAANTGVRSQTLEGHSSSVNSVAFSPNGKLVASASDDSTVILWATDTSERRQALEGHSSSVNSVALSPDGKLVASVANDNTAILWAADTGKRCQTLEGHLNWVNSVAFSPNSKLVVSASNDKTVILWGVGMDERRQTFEGHSSSVNSVAFSPDGKLVASASYDKTVILWATDTGERCQTLEGHSSWVNFVAFSPNGELVASTSYDDTVILWAVNTGERCHTLEGHSSWVNSVAFSPNGELVASASDDTTVILWAADTGEHRQTLEGHSSSVNSVALSPDGKLVASASDDNTVIVWTTDTGERCQTFEGHSSWVNSVAFSPDGKLVASASYDNVLILWASDTGEHHRIINLNISTSRLDFDASAQHVLTDIGAFSICSASDDLTAHTSGISTRASDSPQSVDRVGYGFSVDRCWICLNGELFLWVPPEYRPGQSAIFGSTIAIGCSSGRVVIVQLH